WVLGWIVAALGGVVLAHGIAWRTMFAVGLLPVALAAVGFSLVPESPRYLLAHGRRREAEALAQMLADRFGTRPELPPQERAGRGGSRRGGDGGRDGGGRIGRGGDLPSGRRPVCLAGDPQLRRGTVSHTDPSDGGGVGLRCRARRSYPGTCGARGAPPLLDGGARFGAGRVRVRVGHRCADRALPGGGDGRPVARRCG